VTAEQRREATVANITLESPSLDGGSAVQQLPSVFTCDGKNSWPSLKWSGIPAGTEELALMLVNTQPVNGSLFFDWAVTGLDPGLEGLEAGRLPKGVVVGRNGSGKTAYSVCPPRGSSETYFFTLYALPRPLEAKSGFDPVALREEALNVSHNVGLLPVSYARS
jgi:phosphatidylethanolamine-binding protein (PEBP) family uncharacterized protein